MNKSVFAFIIFLTLSFSTKASLPWNTIAEGNEYWAKMLGVNSVPPKRISTYQINKTAELKPDASIRLINAALQYQTNQLSSELCRFADSLKFAIVYLSGGVPVSDDKFSRAGWWKLSYPVALRYGLKINAEIDERYDFEKSTRAAMNYAKDLHKTFPDKSWLVAFVEGPLSVARPLNRSTVDSSIASLNALKKLVAATQYSKGEEYAVQYFYANVKTWKAPERIHADLIIEKTGIQENVFYALNPDVKSKIIPPKTELKLTNLALENLNKNEEDIILLSGLRIEEGSEKIAVAQKRSTSSQSTSSGTSSVYKVRRGDNLGFIAERFGVGVSQLKSWNNLRSDVIFAGQKLVVYSQADRVSVTSSSVKNANEEEKTEMKAGEYITYKVKSGDTLWSIAQKFPGVSPDNLMDWNAVSTDIKVDQKLKIMKSEIRNYSSTAYPDFQ